MVEEVESDTSMAPGAFCFPQGKQKTPYGAPPGVFCFPTVAQVSNNRIFISSWVINENTGNEYFRDELSKNVLSELQYADSLALCINN